MKIASRNLFSTPLTSTYATLTNEISGFVHFEKIGFGKMVDMKNKLIVHAKSSCGEEGTVWFMPKEGRTPRQYYGLSVSCLNRAFNWGAPWKVVSHELVEEPAKGNQ